MIGLALQGGGARGAYQAGAVLAFKKMKIKFNGVCGTSIGAVNGAMVACGKEKELFDFWNNVDMGVILGFDEEFLRKKINNEHDLNYYKLGFLNFLNILKSRGIDAKGLRNVLENFISEEELKKSKIDFGLCTVRLNNLKPLYIFKSEMINGKMIDYILASCYLPIFKREKMVDEHYYLDGGFYDNTPLNMLIEKGYKKIYVVELNPLLNINRKPKKEVEIIKITPKRSLGGVVDFDIDSVREHIKMGYYDTIKVLKHLDGYYYCFKNLPNFFYTYFTRKVSYKEKEYLKGFFHVKNDKDLVIKSLEYIMKNEKFDYYNVYNPLEVVKKIKNNYPKKHVVYKFIRKLS